MRKATSKFEYFAPEMTAISTSIVVIDKTQKYYFQISLNVENCTISIHFIILFPTTEYHDLFLDFGPSVFLRSVKHQQMHHSFNVLVLNMLLHVSAF
jgi:hypothetical protein